MHYPAQHNHLVSEGSLFGGETNSRLQPAPRDLNMSARNIPSACRIANIALNDAVICLTMRLQAGWNFRKGQVEGAINAPAHRGSAGAAVHRQQKRRVDLHVVDTAADQLVKGFGA